MARRPPERVEPGFGPRPGQPAQPGLTAGERLTPVESTVDQGDSGWGGVAIFLLVAFAAGVAYWWWWSGRPMPWDDPKPVPTPAAVTPPAAPLAPAPTPTAPTPTAPTSTAPPAAQPAAPAQQNTPAPQATPAAPVAPPPAPSVNRRQPQPAAASLPADVPPPDQRPDGYCRDLTIEPAPGSKVTVPLQRRMCWDARTQSWTTAAIP